MTDESQARMDAFFEAVHFDKAVDWRKSAEAATDPDDSPEDEEDDPPQGNVVS